MVLFLRQRHLRHCSGKFKDGIFLQIEIALQNGGRQISTDFRENEENQHYSQRFTGGVSRCQFLHMGT